MTDQDRLLNLGAPTYIPWLEEQKVRRVSELIGLFRTNGELTNKVAEIVVLTDLISSLRAKQEQTKAKGTVP